VPLLVSVLVALRRQEVEATTPREAAIAVGAPGVTAPV
jgi:hypothetical protein